MIATDAVLPSEPAAMSAGPAAGVLAGILTVAAMLPLQPATVDGLSVHAALILRRYERLDRFTTSQAGHPGCFGY